MCLALFQSLLQTRSLSPRTFTKFFTLLLLVLIQPQVSSVSIPPAAVWHLSMDPGGTPINRQWEGPAVHGQACQLQRNSRHPNVLFTDSQCWSVTNSAWRNKYLNKQWYILNINAYFLGLHICNALFLLGHQLTMWTTPVTPTTSSRPSSMRGFSKRLSLSDPQRSAPDPQLRREHATVTTYRPTCHMNPGRPAPSPASGGCCIRLEKLDTLLPTSWMRQHSFPATQKQEGLS